MNELSSTRVYLYDGVGQPWFSVAGVRDHLAHWLPCLGIELRGDPLARALLETSEAASRREAEPGPRNLPGAASCHPPAASRREAEPGPRNLPGAASPHPAAASLAERLCQLRILNPAQPLSERARRTLKPEADYELRLLAGTLRAAPGVPYDGVELQRIALGLLPAAESRQEIIHIWFTERLLATWDEDDRRYHARVSVFGFPSILSTAGMVQALARERQYYLARRLGVGAEDALQAAGDCLGCDDPRATEVAKGYAMQAVFYALTGEPFCDQPTCRLYNAHWQREMLAAQLGGGDYCRRHRELLAAWQAEVRDRSEGVTR